MNPFKRRKIEDINVFDEIYKSFPGGVVEMGDFSDEDVFIVGFPKSGNTLMQFVMSHLVYGVNESNSLSLANIIVPDIYANKYYFKFNRVNYFKSHELPVKEYKRVIYIVRDGRDAIYSYFHMLNNQNQDVKLNDLFNETIKFNNCTWRQHVRSWIENKYNADILYIRFEDLISDKSETLKKIISFLNLDVNEYDVQKVIDRTSVKSMQEYELKDDWVRMKEEIGFDKDKNVVRKGVIGDYKTEFVNEISRFEEASKLELAYFNYV